MKKAIVLANIVVAFVLAGAIFLHAVMDRTRVIEAAYRDAENLSEALSEHTRQILVGIDIGIRSIAEGVEQGKLDRSLDRMALYELLKNNQAASPLTYAFYVLDQQGRPLVGSPIAAPAAADLSNSPEFQVHRNGVGDGLFIGRPHKDRTGLFPGRWIVNISRRIDNPNGSFGGVAVAAVSLDYLLDFYEMLRVGEQGVVGLFNSDGVLLARSPFAEQYIGRDFSKELPFTEQLPRAHKGRMTITSPADGVSRFTAYHRVDDIPAIVYVGLGERDVLEAWRHRLTFVLAIGAVAMVLFGGGSILAGLYFVRRQEWERRRVKRLKLIADESAALIRCPDVQSLLTRITEVSRRLIGANLVSASLTTNEKFAQEVQANSLSDKYAKWRDFDEAPNGEGIYRLVCTLNRPMMLTQAELEAHPAWKGFGAARDRHPPLNGWLAVPIVSQDGRNLGLIQLSDKEGGEFTPGDLNEISQFALIAGVAIDNLRAIEAREAALAEATGAKAYIETVFTSISDAVYVLDPEWRFTYLNVEAERLFKHSKAELVGRNIWSVFPEAKETVLYMEYLRARAENTPVSFEFYFAPLAGWYSVRAFPHERGLTAYVQDITRRIEAEERLRQSQKLDAIGQLTGGVAHDFNNLLTVILGNADAVAGYVADAPAPVPAMVETIQKAGERAAELTHRLLAFARRQPLDPRITDINELVEDLEDLLTRTLGENLHVELARGRDLWKATVDPSELENAIINLALNARDAMPNGGTVTIATENTTIGDADVRDDELKPGQYVMITVSDTGGGMSTDVLQRAFEPFFTTKAEGKGSGLGLSMVYGFARQSGGHVCVHSQVGEGTSVRLYIPRADEDSEPLHARMLAQAVERGDERILVVEDNEFVRQYTVSSLRSLGYKVAESANGAEALARLDDGEAFDLLLSDVVLPSQISGDEVATEALKKMPDLKVLFMSGHAESSIVHDGRLDRGVNLLGKPFRLAELARKVRAVLDA